MARDGKFNIIKKVARKFNTSRKTTVISLIALALIVAFTTSSTYGYFKTSLGIDSNLKLKTGSLKVNFLGGDEKIIENERAVINISTDENLIPGKSVERSISIKNTGSLTQKLLISLDNFKENKIKNSRGTSKFLLDYINCDIKMVKGNTTKIIAENQNIKNLNKLSKRVIISPYEKIELKVNIKLIDSAPYSTEKRSASFDIVLDARQVNDNSYSKDKYFSYVTRSKNNIITTGEYPKPIVKIYASAGPVFKGALPDKPNYESPSYVQWFKNAESYILNDISRKSQGNTVGESFNQYSNISNLGETSVRNNIGSTYFKSWKGNVISKKDDIHDKRNEHGTIVHYIVAIANPIKEDLNYGKIQLDSSNINISQWDIFRSMKSKNEYKVDRESEDLAPIGNPRRVLTYDWKGNEYKRNNGYGNSVAKEADLIIFDIGGKGYYSLNEYSGIFADELAQSALNNLMEKLQGYRAHAELVGWPWNRYWETNWQGKMRYIVLNKMVPNNDIYCRLDRTECSIKFKYKDYEVNSGTYTIKFMDNRKASESLNKKSNKNNEKVSNNTNKDSSNKNNIEEFKFE
ncbi:hypothetical protein [Haloimpatiens massiliensis]|uniref:hypothetical protein n=1 Tax=Haloimpatiens massiliensis TaxID=1658110 RepID=UPI000C8272B4|nr:hypothetical protein [Haloimpatiens massiliensis]